MTNKTIRPGKLGAVLALGLGLGLGLGGCDVIDPTEVTNPQTTPADLASAKNPTLALLPGVRAQFARALGATVTVTEVVSDNYSIQGTGLSSELDDPNIINPGVGSLNTTGGTGIYWNLQELRALADFVLNEIAPSDDTATPEAIAEAHYYRGMAFLMQGENFLGVPIQANAEPLPAKELIRLAVEDFQAALQLNPTVRTRAALARAFRALGDQTQAVAFAQQALAADPAFAVVQDYDANELENNPFFFLVARALQEMQPLPRLDFLDPKYTDRGSPIPVHKAEEMLLILSEAAMARGDFETGRDFLAQAVGLARQRVDQGFVQPFEDIDLRKNADLSIRPRDAEILIAAGPESPFRPGLVLERPGVIATPTLSFTQLTPAEVREIPLSDQIGLIRSLYLARQEIMFLEGRRMSDLGIRLPVTRREIDASTVLTDASPFAQTVVPSWIPTGNGLDLFTPASPYVGGAGEELSTREVVILHNLNLAIARNFQQASPFLRP